MLKYFNPLERKSLKNFTNALHDMLIKNHCTERDIILICIGSDRATGDCLGPIVGHKLTTQENKKSGYIRLYGTLENPVHAKNLERTMKFIQLYYPDALVIAIDASLGVIEHVGYVTLGEGHLCPGVGVDKKLPTVGDIFITGIVNISGFSSQTLLQTTHLNLVMKLADFISSGLTGCLQQIQPSQFRSPLQRAE